MRATEHLGRYRLVDLVTQDEGVGHQLDVYLWRGYDLILDRPVAVRVMSADDPRSAAVIGAARAASLVDDRRLLRVLDVLDLPSTAEDRARIAVVSEWANGRNLERLLQDRDGRPFATGEALSIVADVAWALAAGSAENVNHGRLRPSSVFITDAGEVRVRGLAVDAALFGPLPEPVGRNPYDRAQADVDALGSLVYLLCTGTWPGEGTVSAPTAPRGAGDILLPPSQVRAAVPRTVDDVVARSIASAVRPKGVAKAADAGAFAAMVNAALDHVAPVYAATSTRSADSAAHRALVWVGRIAAVVVAVALVVGVFAIGWQMVSTSTTSVAATANPVIDQMLTASAKPVEDAGSTIATVFPITKFRSYDPFGDDDGNGKADRRKGQENEDLAVDINDADPETAWTTDEYSSADLDGKAGTGIVLDLGEARDIQQVKLGLVGEGSTVEIRVGDKVFADPALWTLMATATGATDALTVRTPRPITGRYVLAWFTRLPPAQDRFGRYQGGVTSAEVSG